MALATIERKTVLNQCHHDPTWPRSVIVRRQTRRSRSSPHFQDISLFPNCPPAPLTPVGAWTFSCHHFFAGHDFFLVGMTLSMAWCSDWHDLAAFWHLPLAQGPFLQSWAVEQFPALILTFLPIKIFTPPTTPSDHCSLGTFSHASPHKHFPWPSFHKIEACLMRTLMQHHLESVNEFRQNYQFTTATKKSYQDLRTT